MISINSFQSKTSEMVSLLKRLAEAESPTTNKAAVDHMGAIVAREMQKLGAQVEFDRQAEAGDNVIARWQGDSSLKSLVLLFHMDTVYPVGTVERQPVLEKDGALFGPGVLDMKGGIAIFAAAVKKLNEAGMSIRRPMTALFTSDEETGSHHSLTQIERLTHDAAVVFCMEPAMPDGSLKTWRKGVGSYTVSVHGKAAHAGADHQNGINAIEELAHHVIAIQALTDYEKGTTLNVGKIFGGTASNVVPEFASAKVDFRVLLEEEADRIAAWMSAVKPVLQGTSVEITGSVNRPPMPRNELMVQTFEKAKQIASEIGLNLIEGGSGGGSDANFVAPLGVPVLDGLGAVGEGMHSEGEYIRIDSLPERAALLAALLSEW